MFSFLETFNDVPDIHIVDIGASPIDGDPVYQPILDGGGFRLTGFEPSPEMYDELMKKKHPHMTFLPYAIGDGKEATLNVCYAPGMTSLLEPDMEVLSHFHGFETWAEVIKKEALLTHRLDDLKEVQDIDFIKLDVQGSELAILENGVEKLKSTLVVHMEVNFIPFYKNQPLFAELDLALRKMGFSFHKFGNLNSRVFKPLIKNNNIYEGMSQVLWTDAVYVRNFIHFKELASTQLLKIARIAHDVYGSVDLAQLALVHADEKAGTQRQKVYFDCLAGKS